MVDDQVRLQEDRAAGAEDPVAEVEVLTRKHWAAGTQEGVEAAHPCPGRTAQSAVGPHAEHLETAAGVEADAAGDRQHRSDSVASLSTEEIGRKQNLPKHEVQLLVEKTAGHGFQPAGWYLAIVIRERDQIRLGAFNRRISCPRQADFFQRQVTQVRVAPPKLLDDGRAEIRVTLVDHQHFEIRKLLSDHTLDRAGDSFRPVAGADGDREVWSRDDAHNASPATAAGS